jgi:hypothetical protein
MKIYPLDAPTNNAGIYAIANRVTGQMYIGKSKHLKRRYQEWRSVFQSGLGHKNLRLKDAIANVSDWEFKVLLELPENTSEEELDKLERDAIQKATLRASELVLNAVIPVQGRTKTAGETSPKSRVLDHAGGTISYATAARELGVRTKSLQKRLANYRVQGITEIELSTLKELSEKYRGSKNTL